MQEIVFSRIVQDALQFIHQLMAGTAPGVPDANDPERRIGLITPHWGHYPFFSRVVVGDARVLQAHSPVSHTPEPRELGDDDFPDDDQPWECPEWFAYGRSVDFFHDNHKVASVHFYSFGLTAEYDDGQSSSWRICGVSYSVHGSSPTMQPGGDVTENLPWDLREYVFPDVRAVSTDRGPYWCR